MYDAGSRRPLCRLQVSSVSIHPSAGLVAVSCGCRRFEDGAEDEEATRCVGRRVLWVRS